MTQRAAYTYVRDDAARIVTVTIFASLTYEMWVECVARQVEEGAWEYGILYDLTYPVAELPNEHRVEMLRTIAELTVEYGPKGPLAIVYTDDSRFARTSGWIDVIAGQLPSAMRAFRSTDAAVAWLLKELGQRAQHAFE